jgi:hypothetical protein
MIGFGTLTLLRNPEQAAEVRGGDPAVVNRAVEELLRLLTVVRTGRRRVAIEDIERAAGGGCGGGHPLPGQDGRVRRPGAAGELVTRWAT